MSNLNIVEDIKSIPDVNQVKCDVTSIWFWVPFVVSLIVLGQILNYLEEQPDNGAFVTEYKIWFTVGAVLISILVGRIVRRRKELKVCGSQSRFNPINNGGDQSMYARFPSLASVAAESRGEVLGGISNPFYSA